MGRKLDFAREDKVGCEGGRTPRHVTRFLARPILLNRPRARHQCQQLPGPTIETLHLVNRREVSGWIQRGKPLLAARDAAEPETAINGEFRTSLTDSPRGSCARELYGPMCLR
jgi:hypothetical protein